MDAVEFLKTARRMCSTYENCANCPIKNRTYDCFGDIQAIEEINEVVRNVVKWASEHPVKTRQSEFLKMFPNALIHETIYICPQYVEEDFKCPRKFCRECRNNYWLAEVE